MNSYSVSPLVAESELRRESFGLVRIGVEFIYEW